MLAAPFTEQVFHFVIPALADPRTVFPYEPFLTALLSLEGRRPTTSGGGGLGEGLESGEATAWEARTPVTGGRGRKGAWDSLFLES